MMKFIFAALMAFGSSIAVAKEIGCPSPSCVVTLSTNVSGTSATRMTVLNNGNFGFGTTTPISPYHLHVNTNENLRFLSSTVGGFGTGTAIQSFDDSTAETQLVVQGSPLKLQSDTQVQAIPNFGVNLGSITMPSFVFEQVRAGTNRDYVIRSGGDVGYAGVLLNSTDDAYSMDLPMTIGGSEVRVKGQFGVNLSSSITIPSLVFVELRAGTDRNLDLRSGADIGRGGVLLQVADDAFGTNEPLALGASDIQLRAPVTITDTGGNGGTLPHTCTTRTSSAGTITQACSGGEVAVGGGYDCGNVALFATYSKPTGGPPATGWTASCVTDTATLVYAICCQY